MHMADALISPTVGITMLAVSGGLLGLSVKKIQREMDDRMIPLMGVMGAFVFAAQMINFTIPGTGSSGHIGGGLLLAAVLGPWGAFMAIASVLLVQRKWMSKGVCVNFLLGSSLLRRRHWSPTPVLLPGKSHGQRGLVGYSPWGC